MIVASIMYLPAYFCLYRKFILLLRPSLHLFQSFASVHINNASGEFKQYRVPYDEFYEGVVSHEKDSSVHAHINDRGILTAMIISQNEQYHIEVS